MSTEGPMCFYVALTWPWVVLAYVVVAVLVIGMVAYLSGDFAPSIVAAAIWPVVLLFVIGIGVAAVGERLWKKVGVQ